MTMQHLASVLMAGDFVRVKDTHEDHTRAGKDALVMARDDELCVLMFGYDRYNRDQHVICVGLEQWELDELDLDSVDRAVPWAPERKVQLASPVAHMN